MSSERIKKLVKGIKPKAKTNGHAKADIPPPIPVDQGDAYEPPKPVAAEPEVGRKLSKVSKVKHEWLWPGYLPMGKMVMLDGDPGFGKSMITISMASMLSTAGTTIDGHTFTQAGTILINAEDTAEDTVRSRVDAHNGDPSMILHVEEMKEGKGYRQMTFPRDVDLLGRLIDTMSAKLVVIDPITNHLDSGVNIIKDQEVRAALNPLKMLAQKKNVCIVIVRHLNKSSDGDALKRGAGSMAFIAYCRIGLIVGRDPDNEESCVLACTKCNICKPPRSLRYQIQSRENGEGFVYWIGDSEHSAKAVLSGSTEGQEERSSLKDAKKVLTSILGEYSVPYDQVVSEAQKAGITLVTLKRAKSTLDIISEREGNGPGAKWYWCFPGKQGQRRPKEIEEYQSPGLTLFNNGTLPGDSQAP